MKRVHVLSLLGAAVLAVILYVVFSPSDDSGLLPGDKGMSVSGGTTAEAEADGESGGAGDNGTAEDQGDSNRTAVAEAKPLVTEGEIAKGSIKVRLVDSETQAATPTHGRLASGHFSGNFPSYAINFIGGDDEDEAEEVEVEANENGEIELTEIEPNKDLTLVVGGPYWAKRRLQVAALDPGEERDLGEVILSPGILLSGRILGPDGKGVADAQISLQDRNQANEFGMVFGNAPGATRADATTDEDGNFAIEGVRVGEYTLDANAHGFVRASTSLNLVEGRPDHSVDLHLATGASVSGVVRNQNGKPLPDARVVLVRSRGFSTYQWNHERILDKGTPVNEDGSFELSGLGSEGKWRIAAAAPGYARGRSENVSPGAKMEVLLDPRMSLTGTVHDDAGNPVEGAQLRMMAKSADRNRDYFNRTNATTDENGAFVFDELKEGTFRLDVTCPAGVLEIDEVEVTANSEPLKLTLPKTQALAITVTDADGVALAETRVNISPEDGGSDEYRQVLRIADASGVTVQHTNPNFGMRPRNAKTDENGKVYFHGLAEGKWTVTGRLEHYAGQPMEVEVKEDAAQEATLVLHKASKVRLTAVDATGQVVAGARVVLKGEGDDNDFGQRESVTDSWGLASWSGLAPGVYRISEGADLTDELVFLSAFGEGEPAEESPTPENDIVFELEGGVIAEHQIIMAAKAVTTVLVTRLGSPAANVTVELEKPGQNNYGWYGFNEGAPKATTNAQGLATLPPCDAGEYKLTARATSASPPTEMTVNLAPGQQQVSVELASGVVTGTVVGVSGPVSGATVRLGKLTSEETRSVGRMAISFATSDDDEAEIHTMDYSPGQTTATTDDKGQFRFQDVPAGDWEISVKAKNHITQTVELGEFDGSGQKDVGIVQMEAGGALKGTVVGVPANETPDGFSMNLLQLYDENDHPGNMTVLRKSGEFHFKDLKPGTYTLGMRVNGESLKSDPITVRAGEPTVYTWSL